MPDPNGPQPAFSREQIERYSRHILLPDIGGRGQRRLLDASVRVTVGDGRHSEAAALPYLAAAGIGSIVLCGDTDTPVTPADVIHGIVYGAADVGRSRRQAIVERLSALNPDVTVTVQDDTDLHEASIDLQVAPASDVTEALLHGGAAVAQLIAEIGGAR